MTDELTQETLDALTDEERQARIRSISAKTAYALCLGLDVVEASLRRGVVLADGTVL